MPRCLPRWSLALAAVVAICFTPSVLLAAPMVGTKALIAGHLQRVKYVGMKSMTLSQAIFMAQKNRALFERNQAPGALVVPFRTRMGPAAYLRAKIAAAHNLSVPHVAPNDGDELSAVGFAATANPSVKLDGLANGGLINQRGSPVGGWPPDGAVAANGLNEAVEVVNSSVGLFAATGEEFGWPVDMNSFFANMPYTAVSSCDGGKYPFMTDPRAFYDPNTHRYWITDMQIDGAATLGDTCPNESIEWFAVSKSSNLNLGWYVFGFEVDTSGSSVPNSELADFPTLGFDDASSTVASCFNDFNFSTNAYDGPACLTLKKTDMEAGATPTAGQYIAGLSYGGSGFPSGLDTIQPVDTYAKGADPGRQLFVTSVNFFSSGSDNRILTIECAAGGAGACWSGAGATVKVTTIGTYSTPPTADANASPYGSCTGTCGVETSDNRISATPAFSTANGGVITFALETNANNGTTNVPAIEWVENHTTTGPKVTPRQHAYLVGPSDHAVSFGATVEESNGSLFLVYDQMGATLNQRVRIAVHRSTDPLNTLGSGSSCNNGVGPDTFPLINSISRWGDYSAAGYN
jgi:hypothetical protein